MCISDIKPLDKEAQIVYKLAWKINGKYYSYNALAPVNTKKITRARKRKVEDFLKTRRKLNVKARVILDSSGFHGYLHKNAAVSSHPFVKTIKVELSGDLHVGLFGRDECIVGKFQRFIEEVV